MRQLLLGAVVGLLATTAAPTAQAHPDFSGTWVMDVEHSESPTWPEFGGATTLVITQGERELRIETQQGEKRQTLTYVYDPSDKTGQTPQAPRSGAPPHRFYWDGAGLVTESTATVQNSTQGTMRAKQVRHLDPSGQQMTVQALLIVEHGYTLEKGGKNYGSGKDVYRRQPQ
jgi:hypothetical protein